MDNGGLKQFMDILQKYSSSTDVDKNDKKIISICESRGYVFSFRGPEGNTTASISWLGKSLIEHNNGGWDKIKNGKIEK